MQSMEHNTTTADAATSVGRSRPQIRPHRVDRPKDQRRYVAKPYLPLRHGETGRFLGVFNADDRWIGKCAHIDARFTGIRQVRGVCVGARFRNETVGVTYRYDGVLWEPVVGNPDGCRECDAPQHGHGQRGRHGGWIPPTDAQRLLRMQWRRFLNTRGRGMSMPEAFPPIGAS